MQHPSPEFHPAGTNKHSTITMQRALCQNGLVEYDRSIRLIQKVSLSGEMDVVMLLQRHLVS